MRELERHASPGGRPQPLAFYGERLWVGCLETAHLYAIDPATWSILDEVAAPGKPYGIAAFDGALRVVVSVGADDDRYFYRFMPGRGFDAESKTACPDLSGSHLAADGGNLYLLQIGNQRILRLDSNGSVQREIALPSPCAGIGFGSGVCYAISADEEFEDLNLATLDVELDRPTFTPVAPMPAEARGLAFNGASWWTSHRDANEIVSFALADA